MATGPYAVRISKVKHYSWNILFNSSFTSALRKQYGPITDSIRVVLKYSKIKNAILLKIGKYPQGRKFNATISLNSVITDSLGHLSTEDLMKLISGSYCPRQLKLKSGECWGVFLDEKNDNKKQNENSQKDVLIEDKNEQPTA